MTSEDLEIYEPPIAPANLFGASNPAEVVQFATEHADALAAIIRAKHLYKTIGKKNHIFVEAWTMLGSMLGVYPVGEGEPELVEINGVQGFKATVKAARLDGSVVGRATAYCMWDEPNWRGKPAYAVAGMAQTRAVSRALRGPLGFIVVLAGYNPTPAEEMPADYTPPAAADPDRKITDPQMKKIGACIRHLDSGGPPDGFGDWTAATKAWINGRFQKTSRKDLTVAEAGEVIEMLEQEIGKLPI